AIIRGEVSFGLAAAVVRARAARSIDVVAGMLVGQPQRMAELVQRVVEIRRGVPRVVAELEVVQASAVGGEIVGWVRPADPAVVVGILVARAVAVVAVAAAERRAAPARHRTGTFRAGPARDLGA